jgi:predicted GNAT family acetyltransferase
MDAIRHDPLRQRFSTEAEGLAAVLDYRLRDGAVMVITHTEVPAPIGGRGIAAALTAAACAHARARGWRIDPQCSYAARWLQRHPEHADLRI